MSPQPDYMGMDAVIAVADLAGRSGARQFQIGYLHDDVPATEAGWFAHVQLRGARIGVEDHRGPVEAAEALASKILTGGKCRCGKLVALKIGGAMAFGGLMADGTTFTHDQARAAGQCLWKRIGPRWEMGCQQADTRRRKQASR